MLLLIVCLKSPVYYVKTFYRLSVFIKIFFKRGVSRKFPGGSAVMAQLFHSWGLDSITGRGTKIPQATKKQRKAHSCGAGKGLGWSVSQDEMLRWYPEILRFRDCTPQASSDSWDLLSALTLGILLLAFSLPGARSGSPCA